MSKAKSERLVNLLILLLSARNYVDRRQIRETIEGYQDQSDGAFERMFERDKEELRALGVPIVTGSNDPDSDDHDGYRVLRDEFELPPVGFTHEELAVLGAAAGAWQGTVAADETAQALATLRAAGADPDPERLLTLQPRIAAEPGFDACREAIFERREIGFDYRGEPRRVQPWRLHLRSGRWYLVGHDLDRGERRTFKLARFTSDVRPTGPRDAFSPPAEAGYERVGDSTTAVEAIVALREGVGGDLRRFAAAAPAVATPEGFEGLRLTTTHLPQLASEVCALGADAVALHPPELRDLVVARLRAVAGETP